MNKWVVVAVLICMCLAAFMSGYSYKKVAKKRTPKPVQLVESSTLKELVTTAKDSTYLVFAFSYACPHCLNSIANLKEYEQQGVVDKVIGLALGDSIKEKRFAEIFKPNFPIKNYSRRQILRLTDELPTAYYIKNDSIKMVLQGVLPCGFILRQQLSKVK